MRRCGAGLFAAVLVLAGCKSTDSKPTDRDTAGTPTSRTKGSDGNLPAWLQPIDRQPGWSDPGNPKDPSAQDFVGGRVLDPFNKPVADVFIQVELVNPPAGAPAIVGIQTDQNGVFYTRGLKPGRTYNLTAGTTLNNKQYAASVQTAIPKMNITLVLRDDLVPPNMGNLKGPAVGGSFPPAPAPYDPNSDRIPPGLGPPIARPADGGWVPGSDPMRPVPGIAPSSPQPASTPAGPIPPPDLTSPPRPAIRPENIADRPAPWTAPPANIPGPSTTPPNYPNPPPPPSPPNPAQGMSGNGNGFFLVDGQGRNWQFPTNKTGSVLLVEFMTTTCPYSKAAMPTLADFQSKYAIAGLEVIAVACDEPTTATPRMDQQQRSEAAGKYARDNNLNFKIFVEPGVVSGVVRDRFNVQIYPTAVLLSGTGAVLWQGNPYKKAADLEAAIKLALGK